jgi:hypothetical protein
VSSLFSVSRLLTSILYLVCPVLTVSLDCFSSPFILKTQDYDKQSRDTVNTGHTRNRTMTNHRETLVTMGTHETGQRQTIESFFGLFVSTLYLVCPVFLVSLGCLPLSCILCAQCWQCLSIVFLVSFDQCIFCSSIYGLLVSLWDFFLPYISDSSNNTMLVVIFHQILYQCVT